MKNFEDLVTAITERHNAEILNFLDYKIQGELGRGEQGFVVLAQNEIGKRFALKFYGFFSDKGPSPVDLLNSFNREAKILASLYHAYIGTIYTAGQAIWNSSKLEWTITQGFPDTLPSTEENEIAVLFYVMDYLEGSLSDVFPIEVDATEIRDDHELNKLATWFEELAAQICEAMIYYHNHSGGITHKDIKKANIRFSEADGSFVLVDFGFARHRASRDDAGTPLHRKENEDFAAITVGDYLLSDIYQFVEVLKSIFPLIKRAYDENSIVGIEQSFAKAQKPDLKARFPNATEFRESITSFFRFSRRRKWRLSLSPYEYLAPSFFGRLDFRVRIPVVGPVLYSKEVKAIIDTKDFQRLRGVKQLGPTMFVFPGATHTRFEHSLGTYWTTLRYLERLSKQPAFRELLDPVEKFVKLIVLAALLHDIGHFPYSHWIEEIDVFPHKIKFPSHEERARDIVMRPEIKGVIENIWEVEPEAVCLIIEGEPKGDNGLELAISFINSAIDADKVDYLTRDSLHCGVVYGTSIDLDRLLEALLVQEGHYRICLNEKGKSTLPSILAARNSMYQEVYWHKTVRASQSMFKRFFYECIEKELLTRDEALEAFNRPDDAFLSYLYNVGGSNSHLLQLISPFAKFSERQIYKTIFSYSSHKAENTKAGIRGFFSKVFSLSYPELIGLNRNLLALLKATYSGLKDLNEYDLLIEKAPVKGGEDFSAKEIQILDPVTKKLEPFPTEVTDMNEYLKKTQQAFIFCSPAAFDSLSSIPMDEWNSLLSKL